MIISLRNGVLAIPTVPGGGNHTRAFTDSAGSQAAHDACLTVSKALACVGMRVIMDGEFLQQVCMKSLFFSASSNTFYRR